ncbi:hypothetical protein [Sporomusa sp. KB1]|jgi:hypothetical protein|nr:hypothetical protein [Sporomusa sp. KB1]
MLTAVIGSPTKIVKMDGRRVAMDLPVADYRQLEREQEKTADQVCLVKT